jgi:SPP1 family phage portal protein
MCTSGDKQLLKKVNDTVGTQWPKVVKQLGIDASNTARGWLAYWITPDNKFDYWYINPLEIRPIYDRSSVKKRLQYLIRIYSYLDEGGNPVTRYEFWDDKEVAYLIKPTATAECPEPQINFEIIDGDYNIQPHTYGRIPFIEFRNKAALLPDLPMYKDIIDAMDKVISGFVNDIDDLQEIIWVIQNYDGERSKIDYDADGNEIEKTVDLLQMLKAQKWVSVGEKGGLTPVKGEVPFEARMKALEALDKEFWMAAKAVNPNPPTAGNQSGVYIDFLYGELEEKAGLMETEFRDSIDEFLEAILKFLNANQTKQFIQTWKRSKPQNNTEISTIIAQTPNTVMSDKTKTAKHPLVDDLDSERAEIEKESKQRQQDLIDSMGEEHTDSSTQNQQQNSGGEQK